MSGNCAELLQYASGKTDPADVKESSKHNSIQTDILTMKAGTGRTTGSRSGGKRSRIGGKKRMTRGARANLVQVCNSRWGPKITARAVVAGLLLGSLMLGVQGFRDNQRKEITWWVARRHVEREELYF